jgi:REP element-mobilizing transposase RayT
MPRKPRVEDVGFHHIINRGVARCDIFLKPDDNIKFLTILKEAKDRYNFVVHSLCLMNNHYHLLIETKHENLSLIARQINSKYAQYFNREYKRIGPLWQGKFKNIYVYDENYLYILIRYIEQNPIKAKIVKKIGKYRWSASSFILDNHFMDLLDESMLFNKDLFTLLDISINDNELKKLEILEKTKYKIDKKKSTTIRLKEKPLEFYFTNLKNKKERNINIKKAVLDGYKQSEVAEFLKLSRTTISKQMRDQNLSLGK